MSKEININIMKLFLFFLSILSVFINQTAQCQVITELSFTEFQILTGGTADPKTGAWITEVYWKGGDVKGDYTQVFNGKGVSGKFSGNGRLVCKDGTEYPLLFLNGDFFVHSINLEDVTNDSIIKFKSNDTIVNSKYVVEEIITDLNSRRKIERAHGDCVLVLRKNAYDDFEINQDDVIGVLPKRKK
jgi:hypothetical protein